MSDKPPSGTVDERILEAALDVFARQGFHGTPVRDLAALAGVTVPALYYHFPSKHDLLRALLIRAMERLVAESEAALAAAGSDPGQQLQAIVRAHVRFHTARRAEAFVGITELRSLLPPAFAEVVALRDRVVALFDDVIRRGRRSGAFHTPYPDEARRALLGMCTAIATWYREDGPISARRIETRYAELALAVVGHTQSEAR